MYPNLLRDQSEADAGQDRGACMFTLNSTQFYQRVSLGPLALFIRTCTNLYIRNRCNTPHAESLKRNSANGPGDTVSTQL
jgi:hypothetical protein